MRILSSTTMSKRNRQSHRRAKAARSAGKSTAALDPQVNSDAAGIDVGAEELVAAVPPGRGEGPPVRTFSAFTDGLHGLRHWLLECKIRTVAMESRMSQRAGADRAAVPGTGTRPADRREGLPCPQSPSHWGG